MKVKVIQTGIKMQCSVVSIIISSLKETSLQMFEGKPTYYFCKQNHMSKVFSLELRPNFTHIDLELCEVTGTGVFAFLHSFDLE